MGVENGDWNTDFNSIISTLINMRLFDTMESLAATKHSIDENSDSKHHFHTEMINTKGYLF